MAIPGVAETYSLTGGIIPLNVEDLVNTLTPVDVPLQGTYNDTGLETAGGVFGTEATDEIKTQWIEEELLVPVAGLLTTVNNSITSIVLQSGDGMKFQTGDIIRIDTEYMRVASVSVDTLTVNTRPYAGTAAAHTGGAGAAGARVIGVGSAQVEGSDPPAARAKDRVGVYNLTQIFGPVAVSQSGTKQAIRQYGVTDEYQKQLTNRVRELAVHIEQAALYGQRVDDATNFWRSMGGLVYYITTNVDSTTAAITQSALRTQQQNAYDNGGVTDLIIVGATQKDKISQFNSGAIRLTQDAQVRGQIVDYIDSDFGRQYVLLDRYCLVPDLFGVARENIEWAPLRPLMVEPLAKTGDSTKGQVVCEKTMRIKLQKRMFRFSALAA